MSRCHSMAGLILSSLPAFITARATVTALRISVSWSQSWTLMCSAPASLKAASFGPASSTVAISTPPTSCSPCLAHASAISGSAPALKPSKPASLAARTLRSIDHCLASDG